MMDIKKRYETKVATAANRAVAAAFDGCHKIYLLDETALKQMRERGYSEPNSDFLVEASDEATLERIGDEYSHPDDQQPFTLAHLVWCWYDDSCGLRFIQTLFEDEYQDVIPQLYTDDNEELVE